MPYSAGFHLGFSSGGGGGGANAIIAELKGGEDYSNTSCFFVHNEYYWGEPERAPRKR